MFYSRLVWLFNEHAMYYRAFTIDEFDMLILSESFHKEEFERICHWWNRATLRVDLSSMNYTLEIFEILVAHGLTPAGYSGWELALNTDEPEEFYLESLRI